MQAETVPPRLWPDFVKGRLAAILGLGLVMRGVLLLLSEGHNDPGSFARVVAAFADRGPFDAYEANQGGTGYQSYPYPPGALPLLGLLWQLAGDGMPDLQRSIRPFTDYVRVLASLGDLGLAAAVFRVLSRRFDVAAGLAGAALLALGPIPIAISGYMGQIDSLALLPAAIGVLMIGGESLRRRPVAGGLLLGLGAAVKAYPAVLWLAALAQGRDRRTLSAALIGGVTAAVAFALSIVPFVLGHDGTLDKMLGYGGSPGLGGISLAVYPGEPSDWSDPGVGSYPLRGAEASVQRLLLIAGLGITTFVAWRRRLSLPEALAAVLLAQTLWGYTWFPQYSWWPVLALALAGRLRTCALLQLLFLPATLMLFRWESFGPGFIGDTGVALIYIPTMAAAYLLVAWSWWRLLAPERAQLLEPAPDVGVDRRR